MPGMTLTYTIRVFHTPASQMDAYDVAVSDTVPAGVAYVPGSLQFVTGSGTAPDALDDTAIDLATGQPILSASWADLPAGGESTIRFQATLDFVAPGTVISNTASAEWTSLPGDVPAAPAAFLSAFNQPYSHERRYDPLFPADVYRTVAAAAVGVLRLPDTGFAPGRITPLDPQPTDQAYAALEGMRLEIPALNKTLSVLGIPIGNGRWDLSWLWNSAGYLEGSAYPGTAGNSIITGHVYLPSGLPGPFVNLGKLRWGDRVILYSGGMKYTYEVRAVESVLPSDNSVMRHEDRPWLTLVTCQGYNPYSGEYSYRTVVRAVLIRTESE
jgi:LPXTG-site transpeptidase (sortase) family protein